VGPTAILYVVVKRKIPSPHWELNPRTPLIQQMNVKKILMKEKENYLIHGFKYCCNTINEGVLLQE
jgi:hypothetical protein